ncbi:MAG: hypothetical protein ACLTMP_01540 [Eggerthella lenta]
MTCPPSQDYVHRTAARSSRRRRLAVSFVNPETADALRDIEKLIKRPIPEMECLVRCRAGRRRGRGQGRPRRRAATPRSSRPPGDGRAQRKKARPASRRRRRRAEKRPKRKPRRSRRVEPSRRQQPGRANAKGSPASAAASPRPRRAPRAVFGEGLSRIRVRQLIAPARPAAQQRRQAQVSP